MFSLLIVGGAIAEPVRSQMVLEDIQETGLLRVGIRGDAVPFGFRDGNGNLSGMCLDFFEILLREVKVTLNREAILVKIFQSTLYDRYELVSDHTVHIECGPNTISPQERYPVTFSRPFFITGTQFLIEADNEKQFKLGNNLEGQTIGVLRNTANQTLLRERYPNAQFRQFQGPTGRLRGVQALRQGRITAFASDGILLIGEAVLQGLALGRQYRLVPAIPLDCVRYGMALPEGDRQWLEMVNRAIVQAREEEIFQGWFGVVLPEIRELATHCLQA
jgi:polar amino acid transport system substrate-binding protein